MIRRRLGILWLALLLTQAPLAWAQQQRPERCTLQFLGAAGQVTGSMHLLNANGRKLLVDCGMFQGVREAATRNQRLPRQATECEALLLTHAHMDHAGSLPTLVKQGFAGKIHCTAATADLCRAMLMDSARVQEREAARPRHGRRDRGGEAREARQPLYTQADAEAAIARLVPHPYDQPFEPAPGVTACFVDAGHVLGSASVQVDVGVNGQRRRIAFSGDIGRRGGLLLKDPTPPTGADYVVMESTYGGRNHAANTEQKSQLAEVIARTSARRGKVVIPAFSLQRTQELLYLLNQLKQEGRLNVPVYVDSPLSSEVTSVFRRHGRSLNATAQSFARAYGDTFTFPGLKLLSTREESMALKTTPGSAVIISAAGMCNAGRILHHLKNTVEDSRNTVAVVGHQNEGTLGGQLIRRPATIKIFGEEKNLRADVQVLSAFSGHADQGELGEWAAGCGAQVKRFFVVHGDPAQSQALAEGLRAAGRKVTVAADQQTVELD